MDKYLKLALNKFGTIPHSLRKSPPLNEPVPELPVSLASLFHHYYLDSYGRLPPDPDPAQFEHLQFLLPTDEFRLRGDGIGTSTIIRRNRSAELGQAFCRWFLHDHLNITYFAHMERVLNRALRPAFGSLRLERTQHGDTPDYLCAENVNKVFLSEAKGRYASISFGNQEFASWRAQFSRVAIRDSKGQALRVKGYIVATRYSTEMDKATLKSCIYAEDPESPGDIPFGEQQEQDLGAMIIAQHYGDITQKLGQPILAAALSNGFLVPDEIRFPAVVWEFQIPPLKGKRFVGGYYPPVSGAVPVRKMNGRIYFDSADPLRLDVGRGTFFGVEESIFKEVTLIARSGLSLAAKVPAFEYTQPFYSAISVLRDGSIVGPLDFFAPVEQTVF